MKTHVELTEVLLPNDKGRKILVPCSMLRESVIKEMQTEGFNTIIIPPEQEHFYVSETLDEVKAGLEGEEN